MANGIITPNVPPPLIVVPDLSHDIDGYIRRNILIRDKKADMKKRHVEELRPLNDALDMLEAGFLKVLIDANTDSMSSKTAGTVYKIVKKRATIEDGDSFRRHVIGAEAWHLVDWRANAVQIHAEINETGYTVPGVKYSEEAEIGVRRA